MHVFGELGNRPYPISHGIEEVKVQGRENDSGYSKAIHDLAKLLERLNGCLRRHQWQESIMNVSRDPERDYGRNQDWQV